VQKGAEVRSGELVEEAVQIPFEGSDGVQGHHVVGGVPGAGTFVAARHEGYGSAQRQEHVLHEHRRAQDGVEESFGPGGHLLEAGLLPKFPDVPRERMVGVEHGAVDEACTPAERSARRGFTVLLYSKVSGAPRPGSTAKTE
jgi:hypothetical protein